MRIRDLAVVVPAVAAAFVGTAACAQATPAPVAPRLAAVHSMSDSCVHAAILALQERRMFREAAHAADPRAAHGAHPRAAVVVHPRAAVAHRRTFCPALVDYLRQAAA